MNTFTRHHRNNDLPGSSGPESRGSDGDALCWPIISSAGGAGTEAGAAHASTMTTPNDPLARTTSAPTAPAMPTAAATAALIAGSTGTQMPQRTATQVMLASGILSPPAAADGPTFPSPSHRKSHSSRRSARIGGGWCTMGPSQARGLRRTGQRWRTRYPCGCWSICYLHWHVRRGSQTSILGSRCYLGRISSRTRQSMSVW